jgi:hypothetical protein
LVAVEAVDLVQVLLHQVQVAQVAVALVVPHRLTVQVVQQIPVVAVVALVILRKILAVAVALVVVVLSFFATPAQFNISLVAQ